MLSVKWVFVIKNNFIFLCILNNYDIDCGLGYFGLLL